MLSASGGLRPLTPDQGLCPWTLLGALPPDPRYRLLLRTYHGAPSTTDPFCRLWPSPGKKILWAPLNIRTVDRPRLCKAPDKSSPSLGGSWSHQTHGSMAHRVYIANGTSTVLARNV